MDPDYDTLCQRDQAKVPKHWKTLGTRSSPISGATRNASNPINALLNYLYAILETEVRLAILTMGLDPSMEDSRPRIKPHGKNR